VTDGLFDRMLSEAQATFALAAAAEGVEVAPGREAALVAMAMQAGVVGALAVDRDAPPDLARLEAKVDEALTLLRNR
jgi:hypothetical protein